MVRLVELAGMGSQELFFQVTLFYFVNMFPSDDQTTDSSPALTHIRYQRYPSLAAPVDGLRADSRPLSTFLFLRVPIGRSTPHPLHLIYVLPYIFVSFQAQPPTIPTYRMSPILPCIRYLFMLEQPFLLLDCRRSESGNDCWCGH